MCVLIMKYSIGHDDRDLLTGQHPNIRMFNDFSLNCRVDGRNYRLDIVLEVLLGSIGIYFKSPEKIISMRQKTRS